jgi:hypothetical protein
MTRSIAVAAAAVIVSGFAGSAVAQDRRAAAAEAAVGHAGFADDTTIGHTLVGGAARWYVLPRVAVGPELVYMVGPGDDRDLMLTGNVTFDFRRGHVVTPFLVAGGGLFRHSDRFGGVAFSSTEGSFTGGGGVRLPLGRQLYVAPEVRLGWETHYRVSVSAGWRFND